VNTLILKGSYISSFTFIPSSYGVNTLILKGSYILTIGEFFLNWCEYPYFKRFLHLVFGFLDGCDGVNTLILKGSYILSNLIGRYR